MRGGGGTPSQDSDSSGLSSAPSPAPPPRRLLLTSSSSGMSHPVAREAFEHMLAAARRERGRDLSAPPKVAFILTAAMAPPPPTSAPGPEEAPQGRDVQAAVESAPGPPSLDFDDAQGGGVSLAPSATPPSAGSAAPRAKRRSPGELRRRRLASARNKAKDVCAQLGLEACVFVDLAAHVREAEEHLASLRAGAPSAAGNPDQATSHDGTGAPVVAGVGSPSEGEASRSTGGEEAGGVDSEPFTPLPPAGALAVREVAAHRLLADLSQADAVWVVGGNTFWLTHWTRQSGLDRVLHELVGERGMPYVGQSAGAILAGVTAGTALWKGWDDPSVCPPPSGLEPQVPHAAARDALLAPAPAAEAEAAAAEALAAAFVRARPAAWPPVRLTGLGLVPCALFPHYASQWQPMCDALAATELRRFAATAAVAVTLATASQKAPSPAIPRERTPAAWWPGGRPPHSGRGAAPAQPGALAPPAAGALDGLVRLRDGQSLVWDESQPHLHARVIGDADAEEANASSSNSSASASTIPDAPEEEREEEQAVGAQASVAAQQAEVTAQWDAMASGWDADGSVRAYSKAALRAFLNALAAATGEADALHLLRHWRVLDFGCGTGLLTEKLQPLADTIVCVDVSPQMVAQVEAKRQERGWANVQPLALDLAAQAGQGTPALTPALAPESVDVAMASSVCTFVPDLPATLRALRQTLKPGALFLHLDWPGESTSYRDGFNDANAEAVYSQAGLSKVSSSRLEFDMGGGEKVTVFLGVARRPIAAARHDGSRPAGDADHP